MCFLHVHTKFQLSSFIRSGDIADLLLHVFFSKIPIFQKNAVTCSDNFLKSACDTEKLPVTNFKKSKSARDMCP